LNLTFQVLYEKIRLESRGRGWADGSRRIHVKLLWNGNIKLHNNKMVNGQNIVNGENFTHTILLAYRRTSIRYLREIMTKKLDSKIMNLHLKRPRTPLIMG
jgi:hypothetical protein